MTEEQKAIIESVKSHVSEVLEGVNTAKEEAQIKLAEAWNDYETSKRNQSEYMRNGNVEGYKKALEDTTKAGNDIELFQNYIRALDNDPKLSSEEEKRLVNQLMDILTAEKAKVYQDIRETIQALEEKAEEFSVFNNAVSNQVKRIERDLQHRKSNTTYLPELDRKIILRGFFEESENRESKVF